MLVDLAAALLPPELEGPAPERVARASRRLLRRMPGTSRAGVTAGLLAIETAALIRHRATLGGLEPSRRSELLAELSSLGPAGAALTEPLKALILLAWGADAYAEEIEGVANAHDPGRPDAELRIVPGASWGDRASCDAIVIGSGAGGAFAARELVRAGLETLIVEEGERWGVERIRSADPVERFGSLYRDGGATVAIGSPPVTLPIGRAIGGTTVINSGTCYRPPAHVQERWHRDYGLRLAEPEGLSQRLDEVERTISVAPAPNQVLGRNARLALAGAEALGWEAGPLNRNAPGCRGACQCAIGCPNNAKNGVHLNALPDACAAGATIASGLRVDRVLSERGRATGVRARRPDGSAVEIRSPLVVVAAGATETPPLLRRSGLARHRRLGYGLSIHPALGVSGTFAEPVHAWRGVLQSVGIEEHHLREGVLLEATGSPPGMGAVATPGYGEALVQRLRRADHTAVMGAMIADPPSGRVIGARRPLILYRLTRSSRHKLRFALRAAGRVLLAAGAERVELGGGAGPATDTDGLERELDRVDVRKLRLAAFHPSGTAAAGSDPARHPVGPDGALRGVSGVWVADASILPSCPGVNPQVSIMALAAGVGANAARA